MGIAAVRKNSLQKIKEQANGKMNKPDSIGALFLKVSERLLSFSLIFIFCASVTITLPDHGKAANPKVRHGVQISPENVIAGMVDTANSGLIGPGPMAIAYSGEKYLLVSCRKIGTPTGIFGVFLSDRGEVLESFHIMETNCLNAHPSLAFDGTNFLLVFGHERQINGIKISQFGELLDAAPGFEISLGSTSITNSNPEVAWDGVNYLVVWRRAHGGSDIYGNLVTTNGEALGEFPISQASENQDSPSIASDGKNFFVVWEDRRVVNSGQGTGINIFGARVNGEGVVLDTEGIAISTAKHIQATPHVIFGRTNYFVVWMDERLIPDPTQNNPRTLDVFGTRVTPEGQLLDGPAESGGIVINTAAQDVYQKAFPKASFNGTHYLVSWNYLSFEDPFRGIYAARVSSEGNLIDGPPDSLGILISTPSGSSERLIHPTIEYNGNSQLLTWVASPEEEGNTKKIKGVILDRNKTSYTDVTGDGLAEFVWHNTSTGATAVWQMNALGLREKSSFPEGAPLEWAIRGVRDVTGEGYADIVWRNTKTGATAVWQMNGSGLRETTSFPGGASLEWVIRGVGDLTGDGYTDVVWRNTSTGATAVWQMNASGLREKSSFPEGAPLEWVIRGVRDVTGEGYADIVWRNTKTGATAVWQMNGSGLRETTSFPGGASLEWVIRGVGDVTGDGYADVVWRNTSTGATAVWQMNASGLGEKSSFPEGAPLQWVIRGVRDVTGEGYADIVWTNTRTGGTAIWHMFFLGLRDITSFPGGASLEWELQP